MKKSVLFLFLVHLIGVDAQNRCGLRDFAFVPGEKLKYRVIYKWGPVWIESAEAEFTVRSANFGERGCFQFEGKGNTLQKYDWFFKVDDHFETYADSGTLRPLKFSAAINEGSKHDDHLYFFRNNKREVNTIITRNKTKVERDTVSVGACTLDVLTAIYYARSLDYANSRINDTVSMSLIIDGKLFPIYIRYKGRQTLKLSDKGPELKCVVFCPLLVGGSIFKEGEDMKVWITDDENRLPVLIETPIIVGQVKVSLKSYSGLKKARVYPGI